MPYINVTVTAAANPELSARVAGTISELTSKHLHKDPAVTAVAVSYVDPQHWFAGGRSIAEQGTQTYWLDIKVVDGTNTKTEMATYLEAVHAALSGLIGGAHEESYVLVDEVSASAYGFGGKTQEHRFIAGRLKAAA